MCYFCRGCLATERDGYGHTVWKRKQSVSLVRSSLSRHMLIISSKTTLEPQKHANNHSSATMPKHFISTDPTAKRWKKKNEEMIDRFELELPKKNQNGNCKYKMVIDREDPYTYWIPVGKKREGEALVLEQQGKVLSISVTLPYERQLETRAWEAHCKSLLKGAYELLLNHWFGLYSPVAEDQEEDGEGPEKDGTWTEDGARRVKKAKVEHTSHYCKLRPGKAGIISMGC